jgi:hypothetical protein
MPTQYGQQMNKLVNLPHDLPDPGFVHGSVKCFNEEIALASQPTTDVIAVARLPKGAIPLYGVLVTDTSLGTSNIAIGIVGTTGKYRAAGTFTTINAPTLFGVGAAVGEQLQAEEDVIITITTAALPASGTLRVQFFYAFH